MALLVDVNIGRKVPAYMIALGFRHVQVDIETDTLFTVIGRIDADRRQNLEIQFQAMRPHLIKILGSEATLLSSSIVSSPTTTIRRRAALPACISPAASCEVSAVATALRFKLHCRQL